MADRSTPVTGNLSFSVRRYPGIPSENGPVAGSTGDSNGVPEALQIAFMRHNDDVLLIALQHLVKLHQLQDGGRRLPAEGRQYARD